MRDILGQVETWRAAGEAVAVATVVQTWGSAPRGPGAKLAVTAAGRMVGSVSGGCIEGAVVAAAQEALALGRPRLLHFGVADDTAWDVGLACGGSIDVWVNPHETAGRLHDALVLALAAKEPVAVATIVAGPEPELGRRVLLTLRDEQGQVEDGPPPGLPGTSPLSALQVSEDARADLAAGRPALHSYPDGLQVFVEVYPPEPQLVMVGGVHIAVALTGLARPLGYRTVVVDPRRAFGSAERFPDADELISGWPDEALEQLGLHRACAVAVLTHDPKLDDPALRVALPSPAFYVGALGSRATQARRRERLRAAGVADEHLARLRGPIGLDIGASTPEEVALSVMAEIVAVARGRAPLRS